MAIFSALPRQAKGQPKYLGGKDSFAIRYSGLEKVTLQIPVKRAGSLAVAERIAELCYEQFELGHNKKEVTAFRDGLLKQCKDSTGPSKNNGQEASSGGAQSAAPAPAPAPAPVPVPAVEEASSGGAQSAALAPAPVPVPAVEEASSGGAQSAAPAPAPAPVPVPAVEEPEISKVSETPVARAIRMAAEAAQKAALAATKLTLATAPAAPAPAAAAPPAAAPPAAAPPAPAPPAAAPATPPFAAPVPPAPTPPPAPAPASPTHAAHAPVGAPAAAAAATPGGKSKSGEKRETKRKRFNDGRIEGRSQKQPNSFINGSYSVFKTLFHGRYRWEKTGDAKQRVVLFFSAPLHQWKICARFDDTAPVLAFAPVKDFGHAPPAGPEVKWYVSNGKGHVHDPEVRFVEEEERPAKKPKVSKLGDAKVDITPLQVADLHYKQCKEHYLIAKGMNQQDAATAVVIQGRAYSKKQHQINGVYLQRAGKFHGALCYQKITTESKGGQRYLLYSATKQSWRITDKIQDEHSFASAKVEDRGATSPADLPAAYLVWKIYEKREGRYLRDPEVVCRRIDLDAMMAAVHRAKFAWEAARRNEEQRESALSAEASDARVAAALAAAQTTPMPELPDEGESEGVVPAPSGLSGPSGPSGPKPAPASSPSPPALHEEPLASGIAVEDEGEDSPSKPEVVKLPSRPSAESKPTVKVVVSIMDESEKKRGSKRKAKVEVWPKRKACAKMLVKSGIRCRDCFRLKSGYCTCPKEGESGSEAKSGAESKKNAFRGAESSGAEEGTAYVTFRDKAAAMKALRAPLKFPASLHDKVISMRHLDSDKTNDPMYLEKAKFWDRQLISLARQLHVQLLSNEEYRGVGKAFSLVDRGLWEHEMVELPRPDFADPHCAEAMALQSPWGRGGVPFPKKLHGVPTRIVPAQESVLRRFGNWAEFLTMAPFDELFALESKVPDAGGEASESGTAKVQASAAARITDSNARGSVMAASTKRAHAFGVETDVKKAKRELPLDLNHIQPVVRLRSAEAAGELTVQFRQTPAAALRVVKDQGDLLQLLEKEAKEAANCTDAWLRHPDAKWISQMMDEMSPERRQSLRQRWHRLQASSAKDFYDRWEHTSDFASLAMEFWLEDKRLEDILQKCKELGQMDGEVDMAPGYILQGDLIDDVAWSQDLSFDSVVPMIQRLSGEEASVYTVCHENCFEQEHRVSMPVSELKPKERQGSLNTTWDYKKMSRSGVELLDSYHDSVSKLLKPCAEVELNKLLYLIWKLPHYVTSYHQDTHVPPHFTLYNQVSGVSIFHFLPVLLGIFVTHVGRHDVVALKKVLEQLDEMKIGSLVVLCPGQVAFISPMGSHGVWVPSVQQNSALPAFSVSVIRAAEVFLKTIFENLKKRLKKDWKDVMQVNKEDRERLEIYKEVQRNLRERLKLTAEDWAWMTQRYVRGESQLRGVQRLRPRLEELDRHLEASLSSDAPRSHGCPRQPAAPGDLSRLRRGQNLDVSSTQRARILTRAKMALQQRLHEAWLSAYGEALVPQPGVFRLVARRKGASARVHGPARAVVGSQAAFALRTADPVEIQGPCANLRRALPLSSAHHQGTERASQGEGCRVDRGTEKDLARKGAEEEGATAKSLGGCLRSEVWRTPGKPWLPAA
ncbi:unnamed protein product [Cladocopium goreaui]|uniref:JmjC domain-containing protein n=1 Tax=Cladocopium goreaui TaxID=2562237 RepID=A0A9P1FYB1_9DINO|nr:unnamed protein product [Cladocopium goreaui]